MTTNQEPKVLTPEQEKQAQAIQAVSDIIEEDFLKGVQACDLSGEGTCESCQ